MSIVAVFSVVVLAMIGLGIYYSLQESVEDSALKFQVIMGANLFAVGLFFLCIFGWLISSVSFAASDLPAAIPAQSESSNMGYIAAAAATGLATLGAGYAVGSVGSSALGAVSENPKILGKTLIFVGLAEGIAIYGLIVSIMILGKL
jgi:V/A-type H+-transporting ATPase subunit K